MSRSDHILTVNARLPDPQTMALAGERIRAGGLVAFPTETVYGLGANALDAAAVARIFAAKGRPATNPIIVHVASALTALPLVQEWPERAQRLAERFWPGPLTLVLPKTEAIPAIVSAGGPTVALRVPAHPVALALLEAAGVPIAAPSANRSTEVSPTRAEHVWRSLGDRVDLVLDGGPAWGGIESTVVELLPEGARIWRPGMITPSELAETIGEPVVLAAAEPDAVMASPGQMNRHYAPGVPVELLSGDSFHRLEELAAKNEEIGLLLHGEREYPPIPGDVWVSHLPGTPAGYAAGLYAALRALEAQGVTRIVVELPPEGEEWLAIHDRLRRAATPPE